MATALALTRGAFDLHVHVDPDVIPRRVADLELARRFLARGLRGFVLESRYTSTSERAAVVRAAVPGIDERGRVRDALRQVMQVVAAPGIVLATGPLSRGESFEVVAAAREERVEHVVTHPDCPTQRPSAEDQRARAARGRLRRGGGPPHGRREHGAPRGRGSPRGSPRMTRLLVVSASW